ncbi:hypothetical protein BHE74_00031465 [Ensete ventricosum]|nr:hypothetical protein GW17_00044621 [Ensete ventricosum]RWW61481.1 hypothetical protein BHE74_00031465 [Ensete ventricosum]RZS02623.1 hypothetical protein BHM03_00032694 [Ensete ventricosum]
MTAATMAQSKAYSLRMYRNVWSRPPLAAAPPSCLTVDVGLGANGNGGDGCAERRRMNRERGREREV